MSGTTGTTVRDLIGLGVPPPLAQYWVFPVGAVTFTYLQGNTTPATIIGLPAAQGGSVAITGGTSSTAGNAGGAVIITGGVPGATGVGGAATMAGAAGGATSGDGGAAVVVGGAGTASNATGGDASVVGGAANGTGTGAAGFVHGGASGSGASGNGGFGRVRGGNALSTNGNGGAGVVAGGVGSGTGTGGNVAIDGGAGGASGTGRGGHIILTGGTSGTGATGNGGQLQLTGGTAASTNGNGGDILVTAGVNTGTGIPGWWVNRASSLRRQRAPAAVTSSTTLATNSQILNVDGMITVNPGGGVNSDLTLPAASTFQNSIAVSNAVDDGFDIWIINTSTNAAETATVLTNTGWTLVGNMVIQPNSSASNRSSAAFRARRTGTNTFTLYRIS
jgi:hypothetical protein